MHFNLKKLSCKESLSHENYCKIFSWLDYFADIYVKMFTII